MMYKLLNETGNYRDKDTLEPRNLLECSIAYTPEGVNIGWIEFNTIEDAIEFFNIEPIPNEEENQNLL